MSSKITRALPELVENGIITDEIAQNIKVFYETTEESSANRLFTLFGILGATLVGLGVILMMAHNWDNFPRAVKLIFAFLPMLIGQAILGVSIFKDKGPAWKEASTVFLFFSVGACIALVSQVYHISGDLESFLLAWIVLCVPLMYVTKSTTAIILHLIFITYYAFESGYGSQDTSPIFYLILLLIPLPRYIQLMKSKVKSSTLIAFHWLFPVSLLISLPIFIRASEAFGFLLYMSLYGVYYNIGKHSYFRNASLLQNGYRLLGSLGTVIILIIMSFRLIWESFALQISFDFSDFSYSIILAAIASIILFYNSTQKNFERSNIFQYTYLFFIVIFFVGIGNAITATILVNILLFTLGMIAIKIGVDKFHFGILNYGMLIIATLIACRFFDTNITYVVRGLLFVLIGAGFFTANYIMLKKQKSKKI